MAKGKAKATKKGKKGKGEVKGKTAAKAIASALKKMGAAKTALDAAHEALLQVADGLDADGPGGGPSGKNAPVLKQHG